MGDIMDFIIKNFVELLFSIGLMIIGLLFNKIKKYYINVESSVIGVKYLLKTKIIEEYDRIKEKGYITLYQKENIISLYNEYKKFGEDNFIKEIMDEIDNIKVESCK